MPEGPSTLPPLPWDLVLLIIQSCDSSTLLTLTLVSFDFLAAANPLLYQSVELTSFEELGKLFKERKSNDESESTSRLTPHLSLHNITHLTLTFTSLTSQSPLPDNSSHLAFPPTSLNLTSLVISLNPTLCWSLLQRLYRHLLPHLNPLRCEFIVPNPPQYGLRLKTLPTALDGWTRLEVLVFDGVAPYTYRANGNQPAGLPDVVWKRLRELRWGLRGIPPVLEEEEGEWRESVWASLERLTAVDSGWKFGEMRDGAVVVVVKTEEERAEVEKALERLTRLREKFSVALEG